MKSWQLHGLFRVQSLLCVAIGALFLTGCASTVARPTRLSCPQDGNIMKQAQAGDAQAQYRVARLAVRLKARSMFRFAGP